MIMSPDIVRHMQCAIFLFVFRVICFDFRSLAQINWKSESHIYFAACKWVESKSMCACCFVFSCVIICVAERGAQRTLTDTTSHKCSRCCWCWKAGTIIIIIIHFRWNDERKKRKKITKKENRSKRPPRRCVCEEMTEPRYILKYFYYYFIFVSRFSIFFLHSPFSSSSSSLADVIRRRVLLDPLPKMQSRSNTVRMDCHSDGENIYMHIHIVINNVD